MGDESMRLVRAKPVPSYECMYLLEIDQVFQVLSKIIGQRGSTKPYYVNGE